MKRILTFVMTVAAAVTFASCQKDGKNETPTVEFEKTLYTVYDQGEVDVKLVVSKPVEAPVEFQISCSGAAVEGTDYEISAHSVKIEAGENAGVVTVKNLALGEDKQISLTFSTPSGYKAGTKTVTVIAPDIAEALVYSFETGRAYAYESIVLKIKVIGAVSGKDFKANEAITVPLNLSGEGAGVLNFVPENVAVQSIAATPQPQVYAVIPAGDSEATVKFTVPEGYSDDKEAVITVDTDAASRFIEGDNASVAVAVRGVQTPDKLVGTWKFSKVFSKDELVSHWLELFPIDGESDLPLSNKDFTLTFTKEADGSVKLTPSGEGDFNNFFREATLTLTAPINTTKPSTTLGQYTSLDANMYVQADPDGEAYQYDTYYKLSSANRAFSATDEALGEATVIFNITDKGLVLEFRDYDGDYVDYYGEFDPDFFSLPSLFIKQ